MKSVIGIDIGTTTISFCKVDVCDGTIVKTVEKANHFLQSAHDWERIQDPEHILGTVREVLHTLLAEDDAVCCIGLTCQMHGILYVDAQGRSVSPLMIWQDERGNEPMPKTDVSYAKYLQAKTGYPCASGYGLVTHFYNLQNGLVPNTAQKLCTIGDYIAMQLCGHAEPKMHATNAASLGCFDPVSGAFDREALKKAGIGTDMLPVLTEGRTGYCTDTQIPVAVTIGDNQASFFGSVQDPAHSILVNIGTGSQISMWNAQYTPGRTAEQRPYPGGAVLMCGAPLCGGRSYAILEKFLRMTAEAAGAKVDSMYEVMNIWAERSLADPVSAGEDLSVDTKFCGTRQDPAVRGSITGIGEQNFTPQALTRGFLEGCVTELYDLYASFGEEDGARRYLIGSGNGLRKNAPLRRMFENRFGMELKIPVHKEEAAYGAALYAMQSCFGISDQALRRMIRYYF